MGDKGDGSLANLESDKLQFLYQFGDGMGWETRGMVRWLTYKVTSRNSFTNLGTGDGRQGGWFVG